jgi:hypothetical protein
MFANKLLSLTILMATNKTTTQKTASGAVPKKELKKRNAVQPPAPAVKSETIQKRHPRRLWKGKRLKAKASTMQ